jgi:hypothetical protein
MAVVPFPADTWTWDSAVEDRLAAVEQRLQALEESPPGSV